MSVCACGCENLCVLYGYCKETKVKADAERHAKKKNNLKERGRKCRVVEEISNQGGRALKNRIEFQ